MPLEVHLTSKLSHPNVVHLLAHATTGAGTLAASAGGVRANGHANHVARVSLDGVPREEAPPPPESTNPQVYSSDMHTCQQRLVLGASHHVNTFVGAPAIGVNAHTLYTRYGRHESLACAGRILASVRAQVWLLEFCDRSTLADGADRGLFCSAPSNDCKPLQDDIYA